MKKLLLMSIVLGSLSPLSAQKKAATPATYKPVRTEIYKKGWIDFNKNGRKDVYEDPEAALDDRIEDLLSQMTVEEKTCQLVTLYGYKRVLQDSLPTPGWKDQLWKDGLGAIDEHLNGFVQWGKPLLDCDYLQMAHHGQQGCDERFYRSIRFRACLWPTPLWVWNNDVGEGFNTAWMKTIDTRRWMDEIGIEEHYPSWQGIVKIE